MSPRAGLELREQVPDVRLDRLLRQEEPLADLAVHETVRNELEHLDLPHRRLLLELAYGGLKMDHVADDIAAAPRSHLLEVARVRQVTAEDLFALSGVAALAQFESATLTGVVTDSTGRVIPGVTVRAVNEGTAIEVTTTTNGEGRYVFSNLRPGSYRVVASVAGFKIGRAHV